MKRKTSCRLSFHDHLWGFYTESHWHSHYFKVQLYFSAVMMSQCLCVQILKLNDTPPQLQQPHAAFTLYPKNGVHALFQHASPEEFVVFFLWFFLACGRQSSRQSSLYLQHGTASQRLTCFFPFGSSWLQCEWWRRDCGIQPASVTAWLRTLPHVVIRVTQLWLAVAFSFDSQHLFR